MGTYKNSKVCTKCGEMKPKANFHARHNSKDGLSYYCKDCMRTYATTVKSSGGQQFYKKFYKQGLRRAKQSCTICNGKFDRPFRVIICRECYDKYIAPMLEKAGVIKEGAVPTYKLIGGNRFVYQSMESEIPSTLFGETEFDCARVGRPAVPKLVDTVDTIDELPEPTELTEITEPNKIDNIILNQVCPKPE